MKNLLFCISCLLSVTLSAQNVGIGTTTPEGKLEVKGSGSNSTTNNLILKNSDGDTLFRMRNDGTLGIGHNGPSYGRTVNIGGDGANFWYNATTLGGAIFPDDTSIVIWSDFGDDKFVILQPQWGKVGIGIAVPKRTLHVSGTIASTGIIPMPNAVIVAEKNNEDAFINILTNDDKASGIGFGNEFSAADGGIVYNVGITTRDLRFRTSGNVDRVTIDNTGRMGIGTVTPGEKLEVVGNIKASGKIEVTGELNHTATGSSNMMPVCYASITAAGAINTSSGNIALVQHVSTGLYDITITGENYGTTTHITTVTTIGTTDVRFVLTSSITGSLRLRIFDITGALVDNPFHFIVFKP